MRKLCLVLCLAGIHGGAVAVAAENRAARAALESINSLQLKQHVDVLADDTFEGREAGSRGGRAAAGYLVENLEKLGLRGGGQDGSFYQSFGNGYRNILAIAEGSDPGKKREFIVVGAHYDHVGYGTPRNSYGPTGYIHNGADDNASGVSGVLEVIEVLSLLPNAPKRSILFAFWDGEEKGLLGSKHWVRHPTVPLKNVAFATNADMIGRLKDRSLIVYGSRTSPGLRRMVADLNQAYDLSLDFTWEMKDNSDHYSFFSKSIPVLMLHTGLHDDYHRPRDDVHKINAEGMQDVARLMFDVVYEVAERADRPSFRGVSRRESPEHLTRLEARSPAPPPRLGISWRVFRPQRTQQTQQTEQSEQSEQSEQTAVELEVRRVVEGAPAAQAGIQVGDRVRTLDGWPIDDESEFRKRLLIAREPVELGIQRPGESELRNLQVTLAGAPVRLGLTVREDAGEPDSVLVVYVTPGSAADLAGIRPLDRIYELGDQAFQGRDQFLDLAKQLPSPIRMVLERQGHLKTVELSVLQAK